MLGRTFTTLISIVRALLNILYIKITYTIDITENFYNS